MNSSRTEFWTIGHSTRSIGDFIGLLQENQINAIADVRRFPVSRRYPHFNQEPFTHALAEVGIKYFHFPELGGRRAPLPDSPNTNWRNAAFRGYADYMMTAEFRAGMERLMQIAETSRIAILCAEAVWWHCHRSLIADDLKARGHAVWNIIAAGKVEPHPFTSAARIVNGKLSYRAEGTTELPLG